ncbi:DUF2797 domain-containing protein [Streptomyces roseicoloratus]|uniref:DUF2797 domain-containing protein n=2 Tax=Streptomyces roseicoloratus TaxID=2508722 RepID=A0ABY9RUZ3_9ACTN|nr:DUF2797 domain-containing protein [Streptomyces roseicoloratus]WMX46008.1 DUF2797 domain-containing protein [Streptomyces roseicoloratus]
MSWRGGAPSLRWEGAGRRVSPLAYGRDLAFRAVGQRRCSGARGHPCPLAAAVPARGTGGRCAECARLDRAHSVAADTLVDDPRPYRVYLAWFGPGMIKVGITAEARGSARLLEQGAVAFTWLGRGPLMAARRTEEVLRHALAVPDRIPYARKRAVRFGLPPAAERAAEVTELYGRVVAVPHWAETLAPLPCHVSDHVRAFNLEAPAGSPHLLATPPDVPGASSSASPDVAHASPSASSPTPPAAAPFVVTQLVDRGVLAGRLVAAAGPDLHLLDRDGRQIVLDTRLLSGWQLVAAEAGAPEDPGGVGLPLAALPAPADPQDQLF